MSTFTKAFALCCWNLAWADWNEDVVQEVDEEGNPTKIKDHGKCVSGEHLNLSGANIYDYSPPMPDGFQEVCDEFCERKLKLVTDWAEAENFSEKDLDLLGYYLALECLGHGSAWTDDHDPHPMSEERGIYLEVVCWKDQQGNFQVETSGFEERTHATQDT